MTSSKWLQFLTGSRADGSSGGSSTASDVTSMWRADSSAAAAELPPERF
jgi:hypothetical protein